MPSPSHVLKCSQKQPIPCLCQGREGLSRHYVILWIAKIEVGYAKSTFPNTVTVLKAKLFNNGLHLSNRGTTTDQAINLIHEKAQST